MTQLCFPKQNNINKKSGIILQNFENGLNVPLNRWQWNCYTDFCIQSVAFVASEKLYHERMTVQKTT